MYHREFQDFISFFYRRDDFIVSHAGVTDLLILAPHGGNSRPFYIPDRKSGNRGRDTYTRRLVYQIIDNLNRTPYYVISDIHRVKVDLNRNYEDSSDGNKYARKIWEKWNKTINDSLEDIEKKFGRGLLIDIHSHNNGDFFEIGYGIDDRDYIKLYETRYHNPPNHTLRAFEENHGTLWNMIFGENSIASSIEKAGYRVRAPDGEHNFLSGGYNIRSNDNDNIGCIQIESPISLLRYELKPIADILSKAIIKFQNTFVK